MTVEGHQKIPKRLSDNKSDMREFLGEIANRAIIYKNWCKVIRSSRYGNY
tara:strand:+ start:264 stop:413 length:150 start_codon:yes stop_codon:yes gene_type:complete